MTDQTPHNLDAEMGVLGCLLSENSVLDLISDQVAATDFYDPVNARIYDAIKDIITSGRLADGVTLHAKFKADDALKDIGGAGYLATLIESACDPIAVVDYAKLTRDLSKRRHLIRAGQSLISKASGDHEADSSAETILSQHEADLSMIALTGAKSTAGYAGTLATLRLKDLRSPKPGGVRVKTGIADLDETLGYLNAGDLWVVGARPAMGKAQPLTSKILTKSGWKTMGSICLGDELASVDGGASVVTGIFPQGRKQIYRVTMSDGRSTECCGDHLWMVRYRDWKEGRVLSTDRIRDMLTKVRYRNRLSIDLFDGDYGHTEPNILDPWFLGFMLGDGWSYDNRVRLSNADPELLQRIRDILPPDLNLLQESKYDYRICNKTRGNGNSIMDAMRQLGLYGKRSYEKFIPPEYLSANREARIELLRGLMDSDGWVEKSGSVRYSTASLQLANDICYLIRSIGGLCSIKARTPFHIYRGEKRAGRTAYMCKIRLRNSGEIFTLPRKLERAKRGKNTVCLNFQSIDLVRVDQAQCISVSHASRLYVTDDYIVTHNTAISLTVALNVARQGYGVIVFCLDMTAAAMMDRFLSMMVKGRRIEYRDIGRNRVRESDQHLLDEAAAELATLPIIIDDRRGRTADDILSASRRHKEILKRKGVTLGLSIIDHLQKIKASRTRANDYSEMNDTIRRIKNDAMSIGCAIMLCSQLSRGVEQRDDKRPKMSDLRDSGAIEEEADMISLLYRDAYYLFESKPEGGDKLEQWQRKLEESKDRLEIISPKVRQGDRGRVTLFCDIGVNRIASLGHGDLDF